MLARLFLISGTSYLLAQITQAAVVLQIGSGAAHSFGTTLTIEQSGKSPLEISANYETHSWKRAPYYSIRIGKWNQKSGWEVELIHHKLYLTNPQSPIDSFRITNGYS